MNSELFIKKHGEGVKLQMDESIVEFGFRGIEHKLENIIGKYEPMKDEEGFRKTIEFLNDSLSYVRTLRDELRVHYGV